MGDENEKSSNSRVKVHSLLSVVSSTPMEPGQTHELSHLDQAMAPHTIHTVFYYKSNPFTTGPMSSDLDNLRVSLSSLLNHYPTVIGRLARGPDGIGWVIKFNDAGVRVLHASVDATLDEWLGSADAAEERDLTAWEEMPLDPSFWSPFRIQINNFKCGALAIGLSCTHMHADLTSATRLIKSWTEVHSGKPLTVPPIFRLPSPATTAAAPPPESAAPEKMSAVTMTFSGAAVEKLLSHVRRRHCPAASPFDALAALFWSRIARRSRRDEKHLSVTICVDSRSESGTPYGYFGNAIRFSDLTIAAGELAGGEIGGVCAAVHRHVAGMKAADYAGSELGEGNSRVYGRRLTVVCGEEMVEEGGGGGGRGVMYAAAFREGEWPVHVSCQLGNVAAGGVVVVVPAAEGGTGRAVTAVLAAEEIGGLCEDEELVAMKPNMVVSGKRP